MIDGMDALLYNQVVGVSTALAIAADGNDTYATWGQYHLLDDICQQNQGTDLDHPMQWELLADFTPNVKNAILLYEKAMALAEQTQLFDYCASIKLALAECYRVQGKSQLAFRHAQFADKYAKDLSDLELRQQISQLLLELAE
ncbi:hypothetical protein [Pelagibaculum spongiae]|uniref:Bacterial transcriptional activator domain-containing protein n=1 Tax=Pelagibaculum spongiae TaxID=2080658 RepID=A0A2V1H280_9GAMM|nr:hypothetical protein [Pelagibaculum spongiae]PVZ69006.1 hypothetical protein DC094_12235 [Pelagibaculum spongiae]